MIRHLAPGALVVTVNSAINRHLAVAKAWVKFTPTGGVNSAYNVSTATGVSHPGTGDWVVTFQKHFSATGNFTAVANAQATGAAVLYCVIADTASNSVEIRTLDANVGGYSETNLAFVNVMCFGQQ